MQGREVKHVQIAAYAKSICMIISQNKEIYRRATPWCNMSPFLCKNYAVSCQKAEQPASTACLLAVLLINMHLSFWSNVLLFSTNQCVCLHFRSQPIRMHESQNCQPFAVFLRFAAGQF